MKPYTKRELTELRAGVEAGHHPEYVGRLVATIDSMERRLDRARGAIRLLVDNGDGDGPTFNLPEAPSS